MNLLNLNAHHLMYLARDGPLFNNKNNNYSCQAKRLFGVHVNREHSNQPVSTAGRRIYPVIWMFCVVFYSCVLLRKCYYNPYKAPALINALNRFFENNVILNCMN